MADVADDDTLAAILTLWQSDRGNLPSLFKSPPRTGRLKQPQPAKAGGAPPALDMPYAQLECVKSRDRERVTSGTRFDYRDVTISVWGVRADVVKALGFILDLFNINLGKAGSPTLVYPSTDPATKLPRFLRFWPKNGGGDIVEDKDTVRGSDVWTGKVIGEVCSARKG